MPSGEPAGALPSGEPVSNFLLQWVSSSQQPVFSAAFSLRISFSEPFSVRAAAGLCFHIRQRT